MLDEDDAARLRSLTQDFTASAEEFVDAFYDHLLRFEETRRLLADPELVKRLKETQREHLETLLEARWDEAFVDRRHRVGQAHADVGLEPQWFLGAYNMCLQFWLERLAANAGDTSREQFETAISLVKAVLLDIGLALDSYFVQSTLGLRKALDLYWNANFELRQFAHLTSHDLKTPLATVANLCDEALDEFGDQMPAGARDLIDAARQQAYRMGTTIDELLHAVITPAEQSPDQRASTQEAVAEAIDRLRRLLNKKQITVDIVDDLPDVVGDNARLREVFYNLLSNAAKFIDKSPGWITIEATCKGDRCVLCVSDNGPGIPTEDLERIFAPFRRLSQHEDVEGSGLGLYFVKNLVEQQGGRIWTEATVGEGSRFYVELVCWPNDS
ncbi:MAG: hypothetical protein IH899_00665 [Planctomycetes bacterium]|nr:hypothetical protein [Planctomycetota bacterium]